MAALLGSLGSYPDYFAELAEINRRGPRLLDRRDADRLPALPPAEVDRALRNGAVAVDVRPVVDYGAGHLPGSLSIPLRPQFASWLGWLVRRGAPIVVVRGEHQDPAEVVWQARKIGYDDLIGELAGGPDAWAAAGGPVRTIPLVEPDGAGDGLEDVDVLDVRQAGEFAAGHVPGARHVELGALAGRAGTCPGDRPW